MKTFIFWANLLVFVSLGTDTSKSYAWSFEADNEATLLANRAISTNPDDVAFYSFTDTSQPPRKIDDMDPIGAINCTRPTVCLVHGQNANAFTKPDFPGNVLEAYLEVYRGLYNIISVDWGLLASTECPSGDMVACLQDVVKNTEIAGERVGQFFFNLNKSCGLKFDMVHLVGHSLGGPVSGRAATTVTSATGGEKFGRITALDHANVGRPLHYDDATCTDVHHTSALPGTVLQLGKCDFYVNGGITQPGCEQLDDPVCDHAKSTVYWARSIKTNPADRICVCKSKILFDLYPIINCCDEKIPYGEYNNCESEGIIYVRLPA